MVQVGTFFYFASLMGKLVAGPTVAYIGEGGGGEGGNTKAKNCSKNKCHIVVVEHLYLILAIDGARYV